MAISIRSYYLIFFIFIIACSNYQSVKKVTPESIQNISIINQDSCQKWNMPITFFRINYSKNYTAVYHPKEDCYLEIKKFSDSGYIEQELSFGKCENIRTKEEIEDWTYKMESLFKAFKTYHTRSISYRTIANQHLFVASGTVNFDQYGHSGYKGDYGVLIMLIPSARRENGVSLSILTKSNIDSLSQASDVDLILKSFEFLK